MKNVTELSEAKIQQKLRELMNKLDGDIKALYKQNAGKSLLKSGATFKQVMNLMKGSYSILGATMSEQYTWAINESLIINNEFIDTLKKQAQFYLEQLNKHATPHLQQTAKLVGKQNLFERYVPETNQSLRETLDSVHLTIDAVILQNTNRGIKAGVKKLINWVSKLYGSS